MAVWNNYILYLVFLLFIVSCDDEQENITTHDGIHDIRIDKLSKKEFFYSDTLTIYGANFGSKQGTQSVVFWTSNDEAVQADTYLEWSDNKIVLVVPSNIDNGDVFINKINSNRHNYKVHKPLYELIINYLVQASLYVTIIYIYLKINKIWKRKHEPEVADSQSLAGLAIFITNCILWVTYYAVVQKDINSLIDTSIYIFEGTVFFLIGTGIFVKGRSKEHLWTLIKQALKLERKEADYLLKKFFKPQNADAIIGILHQIAMIDDELDKKEEDMIKLFAKEWNIDYSVDKLNKQRHSSTENNYIRLRNSVNDYLKSDPPKEQIAQLKDMINALINVDDKITLEEELITSELAGMIDGYMDNLNINDAHHVIIVPQRPEQEETIKRILPDSLRIETAGGVAFSIGEYYSKKYAEMICDQYRQFQLFTIITENQNRTKPEKK